MRGEAEDVHVPVLPRYLITLKFIRHADKLYGLAIGINFRSLTEAAGF